MSLHRMFSSFPFLRRQPRRGHSRATARRPAHRPLRMEALEGRAMLTSLFVANFGLAPGSDSGVSVDNTTLTDNITNVTKPTLTGTAPAGDTVTIYAEDDGQSNGTLANAVALGHVTAAADTSWSFTVGTPDANYPTAPQDLNNPALWVALQDGTRMQDGERKLFAQDSREVSGGTYATLNIFLDTQGPKVQSVTFDTNSTSVFLQNPAGPIPFDDETGHHFHRRRRPARPTPATCSTRTYTG